MPKKNSAWGVNTKAVEARERKAEKKNSAQQAKEKAADDERWKDNNKTEQKKKERKDREQQKKQEAIARKLDTKKLLEEEEAKHSKPSKASKPAPKKVTHSDIENIKEKERQQREEIVLQKEREKNRITDNPIVEEVNPNRQMAEQLAVDGAVEARNVEEAISVLNISGNSSELIDKHPEKRMKAAYNEFSERELPRIKAENPSLRLTQHKQILWKEWQKSPENPINQR